MVVMIHLYYGEFNRSLYQYPVFWFLTGWLLPKITAAAVPVFFLISGYLYFKGSAFSARIYAGKTRRRIRRLLVPYIIWNAVVIACIAVFQVFRPTFMPLIHKQVANFSLSDYLACFWDVQLINSINVKGPVNSPLWFLQSLMLFQLLSPIFYLLLRNKKTGAIVLALLFALLPFRDQPLFFNFKLFYIFFFALGSYLGLHSVSITSLCRKRQCAVAAVMLIASGGVTSALNNDTTLVKFALNMEVVCLAVIFFGIAGHFSGLSGRKTTQLFSRSTFFVYCYHGIPAAAVYAAIKLNIFIPSSDISALLFFFLSTAAICLIGTGGYALLEKLKRKPSKTIPDNENNHQLP